MWQIGLCRFGSKSPEPIRNASEKLANHWHRAVPVCSPKPPGFDRRSAPSAAAAHQASPQRIDNAGVQSGIVTVPPHQHPAVEISHPTAWAGDLDFEAIAPPIGEAGMVGIEGERAHGDEFCRENRCGTRLARRAGLGYDEGGDAPDQSHTEQTCSSATGTPNDSSDATRYR